MSAAGLVAVSFGVAFWWRFGGVPGSIAFGTVLAAVLWPQIFIFAMRLSGYRLVRG